MRSGISKKEWNTTYKALSQDPINNTKKLEEEALNKIGMFLQWLAAYPTQPRRNAGGDDEIQWFLGDITYVGMISKAPEECDSLLFLTVHGRRSYWTRTYGH